MIMLNGLTAWGHLSTQREHVEQSHRFWLGSLLKQAIEPTILRGLKSASTEFTMQAEVHDPH